MRNLKKALLLFVFVIGISSCSKDDDSVKYNYSETLKGTVWNGYYYNLPDGQPLDYTITLDNTNGFVFEKYFWSADIYTSNTYQGVWSVLENIITYKLQEDTKNVWSGQIDDNKIINITDPVPSGFRFITCKKTP